MDLNLKGKVALIAGAGKGMGAAAARVLAAEGAEVILLARTVSALEKLRDELQAAGARAHVLPADMTDSASVSQAMQSLGTTLPVPDICVVSAGAAQGGLFWEVVDDAWHDALELKFMGMVRILRGVAPLMKDRGQGKIVVVVGNNGRQPHPRMLPGSAANAACLAVVRGLAEELAPYGVNVTALNPGPTRTDRWHRLIDNLAKAEGRSFDAVEAEQLQRMPKGRIGEADEMARLIAVLCSDIADMVTGTSLTADGGATKSIA